MKTNFLRTLVVVASGVATLACSKKDESPAPVPQVSGAFELVNSITKSIPDAPTGLNGSITVPINIDREGTIADASKVTIELAFSHPNCEDIMVYLVAPSSASLAPLILINRLSGNDNFLNSNMLSFNSSFIGSIPFQNNNVNIPAGNYKPTAGTSASALSPISSSLMEVYLNNKSIKGEWKLSIIDFQPNNVGSFDFYKIKFGAGALK